MDYENIYDFIENYPYQMIGTYNCIDIRLYLCDMSEYVDLNLKDIETVKMYNPDLPESDVLYATKSALSAYLSAFLTFKMIDDEKRYCFYAIIASNADFITEEERKFYIGHEIGHIMCGHHESESESRPDLNLTYNISEEFAADSYSVIELENTMPTWERTVEIMKNFTDSKYGEMYKSLMPEGFEFDFSDNNLDKERFDNPPKVVICPQCGSRHIESEEVDYHWIKRCLDCDYSEILD